MKNAEMYARAQQHLPGGVDSPVRAFRSVGGDPFLVSRAQGSKLYDVEGRELLDYVCSWGPLILGHADERVLAAVMETARLGTSFGVTSPLEIELAAAVKEAFPSIDLVRFVNSGTEAVMSALRLARGFTGKNKIIKFAGGYHGHSDSMLVKAGSGAMTFGTASSLGVTPGCAADTIVLPFNDPAALTAALQENRDVAAVIMEPVPGNMGVIVPRDGYLQGVREATARAGALLIFDEVISGFRACYGGVQTLEQIVPDLTCLGKIIGGGFPVGAFGGRREIMEKLSPLGGVYQAGTLSGNPVAMAAGLKTLTILKADQSIYARLEAQAAEITSALVGDKRLRINRAGSLFTIFFSAAEVTNEEQASAADTQAYADFFRKMLAAGIYLPPSQFEAWFLSGAHDAADIAATITAARKALAA